MVEAGDNNYNKDKEEEGGIGENHSSEQRIVMMVDKRYGDGVAWNRGAMLGKGSFGSVYLATLKKPRSMFGWLPSVMAVKSAEVSVSGSIQKEMEVLSNVKGCPNIIQCYGEETTTGDNGVMVYNLLLEYGSGGTLAEKIKKAGDKGLPEFEVKSYAKSILKGLNFIHNLGYVHCDLKPDNVLLVPKNVGDGCAAEFRAKLGDFGLAKRVSKQCSKKRKLEEPYWRGTPMYLSPEVVGDGVQELPSDIWAFGCIVLEMLTGKPPWGSKEEMNSEEIMDKIGKELPQIPNWISKEAKSFLKGCFVKKAMFRLTAEMLLNHSFLEGLNEVDDAFAETEVIEDIIDIESILVVSETDDEISCESLSDDDSFASEDCSFSYWSEEDGEDIEDEVVSHYRHVKKLKVEVTDGKTNANVDGFDHMRAPLQVLSPIPPKTAQHYPVSFRVPAGV
ncbi:OLC1v1014528C1 [Oldenlandia corymbosa var. corymbosa]|uniref:OLC1v1014528C1 n=1 Tax=Oldenlandia corymbosa var. corymbosa TaxID=529605 RepID=A0AAV1E0W0_OLDCO|nr:OLC1v1014528C1 [Oldenlandia corymbosa var. corymbosa]